MPEHVQEVVRQNPHEQPGLIRCEPTATRLVPGERVLTLFDPVLNVATPVVHVDHISDRELRVGHDKADPRKEFPIVPLDLGDHSAVFVPSLCLIPEINQPDLNSTLERSPHRTRQIRGDESVQQRIGRKPDEVRDPFILAILINLGLSKCRINLSRPAVRL